MNHTKIRIGDKLILGSYAPFKAKEEYKGCDPEPLVWVKCSKDGRFVTDKVIDQLSYDPRHRSIPDPIPYDDPRYYLRNRGDNRWANSALRQYLNGVDDQWFFRVGTHEPPSYVNYPGFLSGFSDEEIQCIQRDHADDLVRLPTEDEVFRGGCSYFGRRIRTELDERVAGGRYGPFANHLVGYWLMTPSAVVGVRGGICRAVGGDGQSVTTYPYDTRWVRPLIRLKDEVDLELVDETNRVFRPKNIKTTISKPEVDPETLFSILGLGGPL